MQWHSVAKCLSEWRRGGLALWGFTAGDGSSGLQAFSNVEPEGRGLVSDFPGLE